MAKHLYIVDKQGNKKYNIHLVLKYDTLTHLKIAFVENGFKLLMVNQDAHHCT